MATTTTHQFEITNTCTCTKYDPVAEEFTDEPADDCDGWCWDFALEQFAQDADALIQSNETGWWKVSNLRLWNREVSGYFHAKNVQDIVHGMAVNSAWIMRYTPYDDRIEYSLSHHDAMGSCSTLTAVSEEDREELGLY